MPLLRQALAWVGHVQTRNRGTVGGSLAHADPSAELPLAAQVLGAKMVLRSSKGARTLEAETILHRADVDRGAARRVPRRKSTGRCGAEQRTGSAFTEIAIRHGDFAMVAAAAQVALDADGRCTRAAFGLGGVGGTPLAFPKIAARLVGTKLDDKAIDDGRRATQSNETDPGSDLHASEGIPAPPRARARRAGAARGAREGASRQ